MAKKFELPRRLSVFDVSHRWLFVVAVLVLYQAYNIYQAHAYGQLVNNAFANKRGVVCMEVFPANLEDIIGIKADELKLRDMVFQLTQNIFSHTAGDKNIVANIEAYASPYIQSERILSGLRSWGQQAQADATIKGQNIQFVPDWGSYEASNLKEQKERSKEDSLCRGSSRSPKKAQLSGALYYTFGGEAITRTPIDIEIEAQPVAASPENQYGYEITAFRTPQQPEQSRVWRQR